MNDQTLAGMIHWLLTVDPHSGPGPRCSYDDVVDVAQRSEAPSILPVERAVACGFLSPCVAFAFAAGYQAALRRMIPSLPREGIVSFCVTEQEGGHPRHVHSTLTSAGDGWLLAGEKRFVTQAADAVILAVAASTGRGDDGTNHLAMVLVPRQSPGLTVTLMPALPFVPEVSHGTVSFDGVALEAAARLPGDGYTDYIRPFRTVEDIHVTAAVLAHVLAVARRYDWARELCDRLIALLALFHFLAGEDPRSPELHVALGGAIALTEGLLNDTGSAWEQTDDATRSRWERDRKILGVARAARMKRLDTAWARFA